MKVARFKLVVFLVTFFFIIFTNLIYTVNSGIIALEPQNGNPIYSPKDSEGLKAILTNREVSLTLALLGFSLIVIFFNFLLLSKVKSTITPENLLVNFSITLIVIGTLYLITAGFSGEDIAPALGLFGTMVGYLLGRESVLNNKYKKSEEDLNNKSQEELNNQSQEYLNNQDDLNKS